MVLIVGDFVLDNLHDSITPLQNTEYKILYQIDAAGLTYDHKGRHFGGVSDKFLRVWAA